MIEENLTLLFATRVLGVDLSVVALKMDDDGSRKAVCERRARTAAHVSLSHLARTGQRSRINLCIALVWAPSRVHFCQLTSSKPMQSLATFPDHALNSDSASRS
jgi:hypothetical protein